MPEQYSKEDPFQVNFPEERERGDDNSNDANYNGKNKNTNKKNDKKHGRLASTSISSTPAHALRRCVCPLVLAVTCALVPRESLATIERGREGEREGGGESRVCCIDQSLIRLGFVGRGRVVRK